MNNSVKDSMQNFAINQALKYIESNPEENIPKLMALVDKFTPAEWYSSQRDAIRNVIDEKNNWYQLILKVYDLDPGAVNTDYQSLESVDHLCDKTIPYAENWISTADKLWQGCGGCTGCSKGE